MEYVSLVGIIYMFFYERSDVLVFWEKWSGDERDDEFYNWDLRNINCNHILLSPVHFDSASEF